MRGHVGVLDFGGWDRITSAKYKKTPKNVQYIYIYSIIYSICTQISMSFPWPSRPTKRSKRPKEGDKELVAFKDWGKVDNCGVKQSEREKNLGWFERKSIRNLKYFTSQFWSPHDLGTITAALETITADLETMNLETMRSDLETGNSGFGNHDLETMRSDSETQNGGFGNYDLETKARNLETITTDSETMIRKL